jgi:hypothetical protein
LLQVSLKTVVSVTAPVDAVPLGPFVPLHPPDALHVSAFGAFHDNRALLPGSTVVGLTVRLMSIAAAGQAINNEPAAARTKRNATERARCPGAEVDFKIVCKNVIFGEIRRRALYMRAALAPFVPKWSLWRRFLMPWRGSYIFCEKQSLSRIAIAPPLRCP